MPYLILLAQAAAATQPAAPPATDPAPAATPAAELAFLEEDQRMTVPVSVAGNGPYRFIIDTGAQRTVLSRELAAELKLAAGRNVHVTAMTGRAEVGTVLVPSIQVSSFAGKRIEAPALERRNMGAPGILGIDTLQGHAVTIDFDKQSMAVSPSKKRPGHRIAYAPDEIVIVAKDLFGQLVVTDAYYRGTKVRVVLDTGSAVTMGNEALRQRILHSKKEQPVELTSVLGDKMVAGYTQVPEVKIGSVTFQHLPIAFSATAPFREWGLEDRPALLLGMDALKLFRRVDIDFVNREVRLVMPRDARTA